MDQRDAQKQTQLAFENKAAGLLGLARRAGYLVRGEELCKKQLKQGHGIVIIMSADTAARSQAKIEPIIEAKGVPVIPWTSKEKLGKLCGWSETAYVLVTDPAMGKGLIDLYKQTVVSEAVV